MNILTDHQVCLIARTSNTEIAKRTRVLHHAGELFIPRYRQKRFVTDLVNGYHDEGGACIRSLRVKALDETTCKTAMPVRDTLPNDLQLELVASGHRTEIDSTTHVSPHARLVSTSADNHVFAQPHDDPLLQISCSNPQQLQTADRCNGHTYNRMLLRMDEEPTAATNGF